MNKQLKVNSIILLNLGFVAAVSVFALSLAISFFGWIVADIHDDFSAASDWMPNTELFIWLTFLAFFLSIGTLIFGLISIRKKAASVVFSYVLLGVSCVILTMHLYQLVRILFALRYIANDTEGVMLLLIIGFWYLCPSIQFIIASLLIQKGRRDALADINPNGSV
jgi:hypothetical protein